MTIDHVVDYGRYQHLRFEHRDHGILWITIDRPEALNATNRRLHTELCEVWKDVTLDEETKVAVITGAGRAFSAGGDLDDMVDRMAGNFDNMTTLAKEAGDLVYNIVECPKPIISAINGVAVGAGLVVALMADISIMAKEARITDGHTRLGVAAGDHAGDPLAAAVRHGQGQVLPDELRLHRRRGGRPGRAWSRSRCPGRSSTTRRWRWPRTSPPARSGPSAGRSGR